jgi:hypothetical protein
LLLSFITNPEVPESESAWAYAAVLASALAVQAAQRQAEASVPLPAPLFSQVHHAADVCAQVPALAVPASVLAVVRLQQPVCAIFVQLPFG